MKEHEFLAKVKERGEYADQNEARAVTASVLGVLGERLAGNEPRDLAAQLPAGIGKMVTANGDAPESFGVEEFLRRIADAVGGSTETVTWDASAVLCTVAEAVTGGQLNQILSQLQPGYASLFGKPELA
ncbi:MULTISPECIES: DUF2267 domain-containing protein [Mycobacteriaceae]|uniref:DUF2267 domain-containing protein n=1 Tax=Mycolicibacterium austroafricanum TaxID=39687 RepID=A0ABT8H8Z9_MYCAO|nr:MULTISPECIES: DUF2267 domain-containing protein [Mycobacteriaceae]MDN4517239.1 DUF2267 domain-containing protein [Mycolicibacterium austroafricanum]